MAFLAHTMRRDPHPLAAPGTENTKIVVGCRKRTPGRQMLRHGKNRICDLLGREQLPNVKRWGRKRNGFWQKVDIFSSCWWEFNPTEQAGEFEVTLTCIAANVGASANRRQAPLRTGCKLL